MHLILGFVFCSRSHQLEPLLKRIDGYVHRNAFNFYAVAHLSEGLNFCSRSQFISKSLVSKMSQNKWFMNIFDFNFGFNFLESLTFWPEIFCTRTTFLFWTHIFWSRTHPHNYFDFAPEVAKSIFVVAYPSVPFGFAHFTPRSGACSPHSFFFFQPRRGCPMGPVGPHWLYKPLGLVHRTPLGSGIKIPFGDFYNVT